MPLFYKKKLAMQFGSYAGFKLTLAKRLNGAVEELRTSSYVDPDPFYQSRKIWLMNYSGAVSDFSNVSMDKYHLNLMPMDRVRVLSLVLD